MGPDTERPAWFDQAVAATPDVHRVDCNGCEINYLTWGPEGAPGLVFIHGGAAHAHWWSFLVPHLADHYRVAAMDLSGHGYSEGLACYIEDYTQHVDDLEKFVAHVRRQHGLGSLPFLVGGESYGGGLSLLVGLRLHGHPLSGNGFCGVLLAAPLVVGNAPPAPVTWTLRNCCLPCCPTATPFFMPNPVSPEAIWNDPAIRAEKAQDSMRW